jgi:hypothetical protein
MDWRFIAVIAAIFIYDGVRRMGSDSEAEAESSEVSVVKPGADGLAFADHAPNHFHILYCSS